MKLRLFLDFFLKILPSYLIIIVLPQIRVAFAEDRPQSNFHQAVRVKKIEIRILETNQFSLEGGDNVVTKFLLAQGLLRTNYLILIDVLEFEYHFECLLVGSWILD